MLKEFEAGRKGDRSEAGRVVVFSLENRRHKVLPGSSLLVLLLFTMMTGKLLSRLEQLPWRALSGHLRETGPASLLGVQACVVICERCRRCVFIPNIRHGAFEWLLISKGFPFIDRNP